MPNNTRNILKLNYHGEKEGYLEEVIKEIQSEEYPGIDFNKFIPAPFFNTTDEEIDWKIENWGTKWNSYDAEIITQKDWAYVVKFNSAWSFAEPVIRKVFEKYPDLEITFISACEGGWFAGIIERTEETNKEVWYTSENNNDPDGVLRHIIFEAINTDY